MGGTKKPELKSDGKSIKLNGVKFLELVIDGFDSIKNEVINDDGNTDIVNMINSKADIIKESTWY